MLEYYIGTIQAFAFNYPPRGWEFCSGQMMAVTDNQALFSLIGCTFGGDCRTTFALPDLRGRSIAHPGTGAGLTSIQWGQKGGVEDFQLSTSKMPAHSHFITDTHTVVNTATVINTGTGSGINEPGNGEFPFASGGITPNIYCEQPTGSDVVGGVSSTSTVSGTTEMAGNVAPVPVECRSPFLGIYVSICTEGLYPPRS